jgi:hypothetical protein
MKIAIYADFPAPGNMKVNACHLAGFFQVRRESLFYNAGINPPFSLINC